jgi:hypothetical protein
MNQKENEEHKCYCCKMNFKRENLIIESLRLSHIGKLICDQCNRIYRSTYEWFLSFFY